jgi:hypothetical protein
VSFLDHIKWKAVSISLEMHIIQKQFCFLFYPYPNDFMNRKISPDSCTREMGLTVTVLARWGSGLPCIHKNLFEKVSMCINDKQASTHSIYQVRYFILNSCSLVIFDWSRSTTSSLRAGPTGVCAINLQISYFVQVFFFVVVDLFFFFFFIFGVKIC